MQHLRAMLIRKYLSLQQDDHMRHPEFANAFRVAITTTAEEVRNATWKGIFHNGLPQLYKVVMSIACTPRRASTFVY